MLVYDAEAVQRSQCDPAIAPRVYTDAGRKYGTQFGEGRPMFSDDERRWGYWFPGSPRPHLLHIVLNCERDAALTLLDDLTRK